MNKVRSAIANTLTKYGSFVYDSGNPFRTKMGNWFFKLAAWVSPNK